MGKYGQTADSVHISNWVEQLYTPSMVVFDPELRVQYISNPAGKYLNDPKALPPVFLAKILSKEVFGVVLQLFKELNLGEADHLSHRMDYPFKEKEGAVELILSHFVKLPTDLKSKLYTLQFAPIPAERSSAIRSENGGSDLQFFQEQNSKYRKVFENPYQGIFILDAKTLKPVDCNQKTLEIFGCATKQQFLEAPPNRFTADIQPDGRPASTFIAEKLELAYLNDKIQYHSIGKKWDGTFFDAEVSIVKQFDHYDNHFVVFIQDITEKKEAAEQLQEREEQLRLAQQVGNIGSFYYHFSHQEIHWSPQMLNALGLLPTATLEDYFQRVHPKDLPAHKKDIESLIGEGTPYHTDIKMLAPGGEVLYMSAIGTPISDSLGKPIAVMGTLQNITERKTREKHLEEREATFRSLFEQSPVGVIMVRRGTIERANPKMCLMLGYEEDSMTGMELEKILHPQDLALNRAQMELILSGKQDSLKVDLRFISSQGKTVWGQRHLTAIRDGAGMVKYTIEMIEDITEIKLTQEALQRVSQSIVHADPQLFFAELAQSISESLNVSTVVIGKYLPVQQAIETLSLWKKGNQQPNILYSLSGSPCQKVIEGQQTVIVREGVLEQFGSHSLLKSLHANAYLGVPLLNSKQEIVGLVTIIDEQPLQNTESIIHVLNIYSSRIAAEIERNTFVKTIQESEEHYRLLFENAFDGILIMEPEKREIVSFNQKLLQNLEVEPGQLEQAFSRYTIHKAHHKKLQEDLSLQAWLWDKNAPYQSPCRWKNPLHQFVEVSVVDLSNSQNNVRIAVFRDITEQMLAEKEKQRLFHEQKLILDSIPAFFFLKDTQNRILRTNRVVARSLSLPIEAIEGKRSEEIHPPELAAQYYKDDLEVIETQKPLIGIVEPFHTDDGIIWMRTDKTPYINEEGEVVGVLVYATDITELVEAETQIRESEEKYRQLYENSADGILIVDWLEGKATECNKRMMELFATSHQEILEGNTLIFSPEFQPDGSKSAEKLSAIRKVARHKVTRYEWKYKKATGEFFDAEVIISPFPYKNRELGLFITRDISERKEKEKALEDSEKLQRAVLNAMPDMIFRIDHNGIVLDNFSSHSQPHLPFDLQSHLGKSVFATYPLASKELQDAIRIAIREKQLHSFEQIVSYEGADYHYEVRVNAIDEDQVIAVIRDMTELKATQAELHRNVDMLDKKNQELEKYIESNLQLENFAYIASHDLREPILTIKSYTELLEGKYKNYLDARGQLFLTYIVNATENMSNLIQDLLTYSKVQSSDKDDKKPVNLNEVVKYILNALDNNIREKGATITIDPLPEVIRGNYIQLQQLFQNLISNGIKFQAEGNPPRVQVLCEEKETHYHFQVRDNGIGIPEKFHDKIFLLFKRLNSKSEFPGTGMGLAICKSIVELHDGKIWVESEPEKGSTFHFTLHK